MTIIAAPYAEYKLSVDDGDRDRHADTSSLLQAPSDYLRCEVSVGISLKELRGEMSKCLKFYCL